MIKKLEEYREDYRAIAFRSLFLSRKYKILFVEGKDDLSVYRNILRGKEEVKVNSASLSDTKTGGKWLVKRLYETIKKLEPSNQNIAYLVDRDEDGVKKPPWFVTDHFCLENYLLVWDRENGNEFFKSADLKKLKQENGKNLFHCLKRNNNVRMDVITTRMRLRDFPVLSRILEYFKI